MYKKMMTNEMFRAGRELLVQLTDAGYEAYFVGGCVRDLLLGVEAKDVDIATNASMSALGEMFTSFDVGAGKSFGIVVVPHKGFNFEIAQWRTEGAYTDGRRPDEVQATQSFEEDVQRRDFTINAMGLDKDGRLVDFVGGVEAINKGVVAAVGVAKERFNEDHLRMLRAVRFAVRFGFKLDPEVFEAINDDACLIKKISVERIKDELFKMASLDGKHFADAIELLDEVGLLIHILPEVKALQDVFETQRWHPEAYTHGKGRVYDHVLCAVRENTKEDALSNFAVLFHDLGKATTHEWDEEKKAHRFFSHDVVGVDIVSSIANRLKMSGAEKALLKFTTGEHMKVLNIDKMKKSKVAKIVTHEHWDTLKNVVYCDAKCNGNGFDFEPYFEILRKSEELGREFSAFVDANHNSIEVVNGRDIMDLLDIKPGQMVGAIKKKVTDRFIDSDVFVCIRKLIKDVHKELS
jgi:poly(A) polymerase